MGLARILVLAVLAWLVWTWLRRRRRPRAQGTEQGRLVRCARCGVYLPESESRPGPDNAPICAHHQ